VITYLDQMYAATNDRDTAGIKTLGKDSEAFALGPGGLDHVGDFASVRESSLYFSQSFQYY
jgi:hypothetical protein